jgi:hypothetical protein
VTPERLQGEYLFVDTVAEPSSGQRLDATWQVVRGANRLSAGGPQSAERADRPAAAPPPEVVALTAGPGTTAPAAAPGGTPARPGRSLPATGLGGTALAAVAAGALAVLARRAGRPERSD